MGSRVGPFKMIKLQVFVICLISISPISGWGKGGKADPETTTPDGCSCNSECGASISDGFSKDWCYTKGPKSCGTFSLKGRWDYCQYLNSKRPDYHAMTWKQKLDHLWAQITEDDTFGQYWAKELFTTSVITSFDDEWDVMPNGRHKVIHSVGAVCQFQINISPDSPYTGLLKAGANVQGLIRMGPASDPYAKGSGKDLVPGVGIKLLRSGVNSANFVLLPHLEPLANNNFNFFAETISNHISAKVNSLPLKALVQKFCQTGHCGTKVGISHLTTHDQDGNEVAQPNFPFKFSFKTAEVNFPEAPPNTFDDFLSQFTALPSGTTLYDVYTHSSPDDSEGTMIGSLTTIGSCVTSKFGDGKLFFRHRPISEDQALRPEWTDSYQYDCGTDQCIIKKN